MSRPGRSPARDAAAPLDDPLASQPRLSPRARTALIFTGVGGAAYLLALLATIPAAFVLPRSERVAGIGGTVWRGEVALRGGDRLRWRWAPLASLANLAFAADFAVDGAGTALAGRAVLRSRSARLDNVSGTADARLLEVAAPGLGFACAMPLRLDLAHVAIGGTGQRVVGTATSDAGACHPKGGGTAMPVPPLTFSATEAGGRSMGDIAPLAHPRQVLGRFTLTRAGHATLTVTPAGAALLPFASVAGGMTVETDL